MNTVCIRFCEPAYAFLPYVSETMNALSSLSYLIVGGFYLLRQSKTDLHYNNHLVIGRSLCAIGVGSTLFHAYPTFVTELMDELPMLMLFLCLLKNTVDALRFQENFLSYDCAICVLCLLSVCICFTTLLYMYSRYYAWFYYPFSVLLCIAIFGELYLCFLNMPNTQRITHITCALSLLLVSQIAWQTEQYMVRQDMHHWSCYGLHALWHVCSAYALHMWLSVLE